MAVRKCNWNPQAPALAMTRNCGNNAGAVALNAASGKTIALFRCTQMILFPKA
jgi:hypothetical protein